jgi:hypothetical protein
MFYYDPEATIQDADIELAEASALSWRVARLREQGICCHTSSLGFSGTVHHPGQETMEVGQALCTDFCGRLFESQEAMDEDAARWL